MDPADPYRIEYDPAALRDLKRISEQQVRKAVDDAIDDLAHDPRPHGCRKMQARGNAWRIEVSTIGGPHRVIYAVHDDKQLVMVMAADHRKQVYR